MRSVLRALCGRGAPFLLLLTVVGAGQTNNRPIDLPNVTGPYLIGRESFHWTDKLMVHISYPTERTAKTSAAPYFPNLDLVKAEFDGWEYSILRSVHTHTLSDAKLSASKSRYPVIIISHGNRMSGFLYTAITEDLASNGYIVAAIDHPYEAIVTVLPGSRVVRYSKKLEPNPNSPSFLKDLHERIENRAADIAFVVSQLYKINGGKESQFSGRLDLTHLGVAGHSNGGTAAVQACQIDKRLQACVNLDGRVAAAPFYPNSKGRGPEQPFMYLAKPLRSLTDEELTVQKMTQAQSQQARAATINRENELMRSIKSGSYRVVIRGATHESFSDEPLLLQTNEEEKTAAQKRIQIVREYVRCFFDKYLKSQEAPALDGSSVAYPEVTVERFGTTSGGLYTK